MESNRFILLQVVLVTILGRTSGGSECVNGSATSTLPTQIHQGERVVNDGDALVTDFTALPCTSDPCSSRGCIRKCCPEGYAMNENTRECSLFDGQFNVDLQDENGAPVENLTLAFRAGAMPACAPEQLFDLDPAARPEDRFSVLPSGHLYKADFPKEQRKNSEYCVDNFIHDEKVVMKGLMCFPDLEVSTQERQKLTHVFAYLQIISSIFLIATFVVYAILPPLRTVNGITVMGLSFSFSVTYLCLALVNLDPYISSIPCRFLAVMVHFFFLSAFAWLTVMSFDIYRTFLHLLSKNTITRLPHRAVYYSLFGWGIPFTIVTVGQILDNLEDLPDNVIKPGFTGISSCWFPPKENWPIFTYFYGPMTILVLCNIIIFTLTAVQLHRASQGGPSPLRKRRSRLLFVLFMLMGVMWTMEIISWLVGGSGYYWVLTDSLNILTGVYIFVVFVCKKKVRKLLYETRCFTFCKRHANVAGEEHELDNKKIAESSCNDISISTV